MKKFFQKYPPKYIFLSALIVATAAVWLALFQTGESLVVAFLNVGQGDAIFVQTPQGNQMLIDGGPNKKVVEELARVMPFYDRSIDVLVLSHPHLDHLTGLVEVLKRYDVGLVFEAGDDASTAEFAEWHRLVEEKNVKTTHARRGTRVNLGDDAYFDILLPDVFEKSSDPHKNMVVGRLTYGSVCFIFTGDMEREHEFKILGDDIDCEVLKVGHHGSKTSSSEAFLKAVSPDIAVIQVGAKNRYGHPYKAVLDALSATAIKIFRTDLDGAVIIESDGKDAFVE